MFVLNLGRKSVAGSAIGGLPETQEMLNFCVEQGIVADIEMTAAHQINDDHGLRAGGALAGVDRKGHPS